MVPSAPVVLDTGTSLMFVPDSVLSNIMDKALSGINAYIVEGIYYGPCTTSNYPTITFLIGTYWIDIPPE